jgi:hypothetical protein
MKVKAIINSLAIRKASMATTTVYKPKVKISFIRIGFFNFIDIQILRLLNLQYRLLPQRLIQKFWILSIMTWVMGMTLLIRIMMLTMKTKKQ